ncbi:PQQ-dependent sugar dehydrogenase [Tundrisphaera lichenicola]|uniref:PQQ-dependent sugar dehydrogenase n=1 Tax=Tundrisphaera lichenicola TaxID=2029860 RepID=UPI003EBC4EEB
MIDAHPTLMARLARIIPALIVATISSAAQAESDLPRLKTEVAFPNLQFDRPVALASPEDGSNLLFVAEQFKGTIQSFPDEKDTTDKVEFLQLPDPMNKGNEEGLLGLAFHPKYKQNGEFFVYYSAHDMEDGKHHRRSVVSRFKVSKDNPRKADPASEQRIWVSADDPFENHNGGCIAFGPDGYLYISLGDSGAADDPLTTGQNPKDWFGSILRIDVDHPSDGKPYGIPSDNPKLRDSKFSDWAPEVYCIGLRNVWKFSFDRKDGTLWAGDVGQNKWEYVHVIQNGGNYGWSVKEGFHNFKPRQKANTASPITKPIVEYPHAVGLDPKRNDLGQSITGGYVYRGNALPLDGVYVYGDYQSGRIWGVRSKDGEAIESGELIDVSKQKVLNIASFGEDREGDLLILAFDGRIHRLVSADK